MEEEKDIEEELDNEVTEEIEEVEDNDAEEFYGTKKDILL